MRDGELELYAFYAVHGYTPEQLAALTPLERVFLSAARDKYYENISEIAGGVH